jgi:hypothetical protein
VWEGIGKESMYWKDVLGCWKMKEILKIMMIMKEVDWV